MGFLDRWFRRSKTRAASAVPPQSEAADPPPEWAAFFRSGERYEHFESLVRAYFKRRGQRALIIDGELRVSDAAGGARRATPDQTFGLGNLAQVCALAPQSGWGAEVARHFERMERSFAEAEQPSAVSFADAEPRLGIRLWSLPNPLITDFSVWREDIPGLASALFIDSPETIANVCRKDADKWSQTDERLFEIALANQAVLAPVTQSEFEFADGHRLTEFLGESPFACSFVLHLCERPDLAGPHGLFFAVPSRHRVITLPFNGGNTLKALSNFMLMTRHLEQEGPGSLSANVYWLLDGQSVNIPYRMEGEKLVVTPPDTLTDYLNGLAERGE
jgi:hypothetical protein